MHVAVDEGGSHQESPRIDGVAGFQRVQILPQCNNLAAPQADVPWIVQALGRIDHPAVADQKVVFHGSWCLRLGMALAMLQSGWNPGQRICLTESGHPFYHAGAYGLFPASCLPGQVFGNESFEGSGRGKAPAFTAKGTRGNRNHKKHKSHKTSFLNSSPADPMVFVPFVAIEHPMANGFGVT